MTGEPRRAEVITSARNPLLKEIKRASQRGQLTPDGSCVAESFHLLEEAIRADCRIRCVLTAASVRATVEGHVRGLNGVRVLVLADELFEALAETESSQGVITLLRPPPWTMEHLFRGLSMVVLLDGIQEPGNAGAIVRAAEAFGSTGVAFLKGTVSPYNPKALRASAGSLFRLPFVAGVDAGLMRAACEQKRLDIYAAQPRGRRALAELNLARKFALIVGSEGRGISPKLAAAAVDIRIPTTGVESLNAAMAAGVILYEASRQRTLR